MRYYFHVRRGQVTVLDHKGAELSDIHEVARRAREIAASETLKGAPTRGGSIIVDDGSVTILELPLEEVAR
jgi:hypothetical protein